MIDGGEAAGTPLPIRLFVCVRLRSLVSLSW